MSPPTSWQPLLTGAAADQARDAVEAIAMVVSDPSQLARMDLGPFYQSGQLSDNLSSGRAGLALLFSYMNQSRLWPQANYADEALSLLNDSIEAVAEVPMDGSLFSGFTGIAWCVEHLQNRLLNDAEGDVNEEIDQALIELTANSPWTRDYDLIIGLVGLGLYAVERLPRPTATQLLEQVIERLVERAVHQPEGICWWTDPQWMMEETRVRYPQGYYNIGLAHGSPGVVVMLALAYAAQVRREVVQPLLEGAVQYLLAQRMPDNPRSVFPCFCGFDIPAEGSRLAWCYGDPGVSMAIYYAGVLIGRKDWQQAALAVMRLAVDRPPQDAGVVDAGLCHGAIGLAHIYNRFYHAGGEQLFRDAALYWYDAGLQMRRPGEGLAGFYAYMPREERPNAWVADPGLLSGATGVALGLLAGISNVEPAWDRMLLISIPPGGG
ncbi:MAG: hypothetical protein HJJLKODD_01894 [Phycisphaerae bacterium]|nr:hypothetical protein [Phycisphaerae bacterium]